MEIIDYLRIAKRRLWLLIVVPLIACGIAIASVLVPPPQIAASALVAAPALVGGVATNQYVGSQAVPQYVSAFQAAVTSPVVLQGVSEDTGIPQSELLAGTTVLQVGTSSQIRITFTTSKRGIAQEVVTSEADRTLQFLFSSQVELAEKRLAAADADLRTTEAALDSFYKTTGTVNTGQLYEAKVQELTNLEQQRLQLQASGNSTGAAGMNAVIAVKQAELKKLQPLVAQYGRLVQRRDAAQTLRNTLAAQVQAAQYQADAADPSRVVLVTREHPKEQLPIILQRAIPAAGAGLLLAVALVVVIELISRRRRAHDVEGAVSRDASTKTGWLDQPPVQPIPGAPGRGSVRDGEAEPALTAVGATTEPPVTPRPPNS